MSGCPCPGVRVRPRALGWAAVSIVAPARGGESGLSVSVSQRWPPLPPASFIKQPPRPVAAKAGHGVPGMAPAGMGRAQSHPAEPAPCPGVPETVAGAVTLVQETPGCDPLPCSPGWSQPLALCKEFKRGKGAKPCTGQSSRTLRMLLGGSCVPVPGGSSWAQERGLGLGTVGRACWEGR